MLCCFLRLPFAFMHFDYSCLSTIHAARLYPVLNLINCCLASIRTCSSFSMLYGHIRRQTLPSSCICLNVDLLLLCLNMPECNVELRLLAETLSTSNTEIHHLPDQYSIFLNLPACPFTASLLSDECSVLISSR